MHTKIIKHITLDHIEWADHRDDLVADLTTDATICEIFDFDNPDPDKQLTWVAICGNAIQYTGPDMPEAISAIGL